MSSMFTFVMASSPVLFGLATFLWASRQAPDDTDHLLTYDSPKTQADKLRTVRYGYFRKGGVWHRSRVVRHGALCLKVTERV